MKKSLAQIFKSARKKHGLTQTEVADKAGISSITYSRIERGVQKPEAENAIKIGKVLSIDRDTVIKTYLSQ
jgi:transcriptional regulator with XRE-family HTH domain